MLTPLLYEKVPARMARSAARSRGSMFARVMILEETGHIESMSCQAERPTICCMTVAVWSHRDNESRVH